MTQAALYILNACALASILVWPTSTFATVLMFDSPGALLNPITMLLAVSLWAYPIPVAFGAGLFWVHRRESLVVRAKWTLVALLGLAVPLVLLGALQLVCAGNFACE